LTKLNWIEYFCEFTGTAIHLFAGLTGIYLISLVDAPDIIKYFAIGLFFAVGLVVVVYSPLGKRSGGHINPAVTGAFWLSGLMSGIDAACYVVAQFAGASLNLARNFGPAVTLLRFDYIWVYFTASLLGALAAWGLFHGATMGAQPRCCKLCYKTEGPCLFKCKCEF
jgi:glycerol uptake facilitator-like aquaporin